MNRERFRTQLAFATELNPAPAEGLTINGQTWRPDPNKAYVEGFMSHAFPSVTKTRCGIMPGVIARSYPTLAHKWVNFNHEMKGYGKNRDRITGCVVGVEFPDEPVGGWQVSATEPPPGIRFVAVLWKQATDVAGIMAEHLSRKRTWTFSLEATFDPAECGFAVGTAEMAKLKLSDPGTPADLKALGYAFIPWPTAPENLKALFDEKRHRMRPDAAERDLFFLNGGVDGTLLYEGVGQTPAPMEPSAVMTRMLASDQPAEEDLALRLIAQSLGLPDPPRPDPYVALLRRLLRPEPTPAATLLRRFAGLR
jgi:hypothetical protein